MSAFTSHSGILLASAGTFSLIIHICGSPLSKESTNICKTYKKHIKPRLGKISLSESKNLKYYVSLCCYPCTVEFLLILTNWSFVNLFIRICMVIPQLEIVFPKLFVLHLCSIFIVLISSRSLLVKYLLSLCYTCASRMENITVKRRKKTKTLMA